MKRYRILISGRVQGVGFRFFTQMSAVSLNLTGWCRNLINGKVQVEIQGSQEKIDLFLSKIKKGNNFSIAEEISIDEIPLIENEKKYSIRY